MDIIGGYCKGYYCGYFFRISQDINGLNQTDMSLDILLGYIQGYHGICKDISGYLDWISFLGYDLHSYPKSQKIS